MSQNKRKKKYVGTSLQKKILTLVFVSAVIPAGIVGISLYYLIFNLIAYQMVFPEAIASNLFPVAQQIKLIILIALPICLVIIWRIALGLSNRIAGPVYRLEKELDMRISGKKTGPIFVREKDEIKSLADKINKISKFADH